MKRYLVTADVSTMPYSSEMMLFGIFDSKEEAVAWIRNNQKVKIPGSKKKFDFKSTLLRPADWKDDERLAYWLVQEFDEAPIMLSCYYE